MKRFTSDQQALHQLEISLTRYRIENGVIRVAKGEDETRVSEADADAIAYLCAEWDYSTL